jgi:hypothetical protein
MDEYKQHLRRLAVHDEALLEAIATDGSSFATGVFDEDRSARAGRRDDRRRCGPSLVPARHSACPAAGATSDEIVASLEAVTPVTGAARVVQCAPKVALALG